MTTEQKKMNCKKLIVQSIQGGHNDILLGIIEKEDQNLIHFRTRKRTIVINKSLILRIEDTNEEFVQ